MKNNTADGSFFSPRAALLGTVIATSLLIAGCGASSVNVNLQSFNYYSINPNTGDYCKAFDDNSISSHCQSIIPVNFFSRETESIENAYRQKITDQNRARGLISLITLGDNLDYQVSSLENGSYRLEINEQTDSVWRALEHIKKLTHLKK